MNPNLKSLYEACQLAFATDDELVMVNALNAYEKELRVVFRQYYSDEKSPDRIFREVLGEEDMVSECRHIGLKAVGEDVYLCDTCGKHLKGTMQVMTPHEFTKWYKQGRVT